MGIKHLTDEEFLSYKIADYSTIPYSVELECPNRCSGTLGLFGEKSKLIGWCDTPQGLMMVAECPTCFEKFRYHGTTFERNDIDLFRSAFELYLFVEEGIYKD